MDFLLNESFTSFDRFAAAARAWQVDFLQLDRGEPEFKVMQAGIGGGQISRARFNRKLLQRGRTPPGMRTFVIPAAPELELEWRRHHVTGCDLLVFPESGELSSLSGPGFDMIIYSVPTQRLERIAEAMELPDPAGLLAGREAVRLNQNSMAALRRQALACTDALGAIRDGSSEMGGLQEEVCQDLAREILCSLARCGDRDGRHSPPARERSACLRAAMEVINGCGPECLTVRDICTRARVSERTLQYAFKDRFKMGPKAFLQAWRLDRVRRELANSPRPAPAIADVANRYGFWHMGQFAADYRRMFGELPSQTRKRTARGPA